MSCHKGKFGAPIVGLNKKNVNIISLVNQSVICSHNPKEGKEAWREMWQHAGIYYIAVNHVIRVNNPLSFNCDTFVMNKVLPDRVPNNQLFALNVLWNGTELAQVSYYSGVIFEKGLNRAVSISEADTNSSEMKQLLSHKVSSQRVKSNSNFYFFLLWLIRELNHG